MNVVATVTAHAVRVHGALNKVIALHAVLVRGSFGEVRERLFTKLVFFQFPVILQNHPHLKANRPIVIPSIKRIVQRLALRVALEANIRRLHRIETRRVDDVCLRRPPDMRGTGTMAFLAADIPFGHRLRLDVVVH
jgi:hypothetical protein